ncbi:MAG: benzoate/toluate 1,2-dioxygenase reductase component, partial [Frankiaceae bacterium]|nr:benzoate/toluate 1,2-dioxygenase reductase component [Frankiaceae bacterium]
GTEDSRSYSFSSAPDEKALSFLIKISPGGVMSEYLTERAGVGDEITFSGPHGSFFLRESPAPLLLLAGGTGLAPILAILRTLENSGTERTLHLVYGATTDDDVVELDTLRQLADSVEGFTWDYCVADKNTQAEHQGYVTTLITPEHLHDSTAAVYLCGPPVMVDAVRKHFGETGLEPAGFYYEKFALAAAPEQRRGEVAEPEAAAAGPVELADEPGTTSAATPQVRIPRQSTTPAGALETLLGRDGRSLCGQEVLPEQELPPSPGSTSNVENAPADATDAAEVTRVLMGQRMFAPWGSGEPLPLDEDEALPTPGTEQPAAVPADDVPSGPYVDSVVGDDGYQIGEEHPSVHRSDAIFDARQGLELGALELVIGRLSSRQLAGYRLLAELTLPYVDGDRFVDAHAYTETNAAFHDYLFTLTGNEHLLRAYQALGVKGHMEESLRNATWCHPRCTQDHLDIVTAFENGDREAARTLVVEHAARSKETTRRAMHDIAAAKRPRFVTPGRFADKVVVVTGAAQGIGERTARRISAEGGTLVLADRAEQVQTLATELAGDGPPAIAVEADLETWEGASAVVAAAIERFGRIDIAVHTVGGTIWAKPFEHYPPEQIQAEINRSLWPTLWSCRAVVPHMIERGTGTIVNVSSVATRGVNRLPYSAAKGGVNAITAALALEMAPHGIRVVATAPGGTDAPARRIARGPAPQTEEERGWYAGVVDQTVESSLLKRYGTLDEQAAAVTFLASDEASYITGTVLPVAGGDLG